MAAARGSARLARFLALVLLGIPAASACSCDLFLSAPEGWADAPVVFVGTIDRADKFKEFDEQTAWVTVTEPFKGAKRNSQFQLKQPAGMCAPKFKPGQGILFYLHPAGQGAWTVHACHRSRLLRDAADDLLFLRALPGSARSNRLSGEVVIYDHSPAGGPRERKAIGGIPVKISSKSFARTTTTNSDGIYEIYGLPPGEYEVSLEYARGLKLYSSRVAGARQRRTSRVSPASISLGERSAASVDFVVGEDTRISGTVLDAQGKAMKDVCVEIVPLEGEIKDDSFHDCTDGTGAYLLEHMPAGTYHVVANRSGVVTVKSPFPATYHPGVNAKSAAGLVTVTAGNERTGVDIRIPKVHPSLTLNGKVQFADGVPVENASVDLLLDGRSSTTSTTGPDGHFQLAALAGVTSELNSHIVLWAPDTVDKCLGWRDYAGPFTIATAAVTITPARDNPPITLTLPVASCRAWPEKPPRRP